MSTNRILALGFGLMMAVAAIAPASAAVTSMDKTGTKMTSAPVHKTAAAAKPATHHTRYYVARKSHGKGCQIVTRNPGKMLMVGKYDYATHGAAANALKHDKVCHA